MGMAKEQNVQNYNNDLDIQFKNITPTNKEISTSDQFGINVQFKTANLENLDKKIKRKVEKADLYKTEMCKSYKKFGFCKYSNKCQFAHDESELRDVSRHPRYKTEICKTYSLYGDCNYGNRCCFLHDEVKKDNVEKNREIDLKNEIIPDKNDKTLFFDSGDKITFSSLSNPQCFVRLQLIAPKKLIPPFNVKFV